MSTKSISLQPSLLDAKGGGTVDGTLTAAIKADDIIDLIYTLKRPYRKKASFIINDKNLAALRKLKDSNGAYMWQPSLQAVQILKLKAAE